MNELFNEPIDFNEALLRREVRSFIPTDLSHAELQSLRGAMRERSLMLARVENAEFGNKVLELSIKVMKGQESNDAARYKLRQLLFDMEYQPEAGKEGTIQDLRSDVRLNLILTMQSKLCWGYGQWRMGQSASVLHDYPCWEFVRAYPRKEPRDWPARWQAAGGTFYEGPASYDEGRMIAVKSSSIWETISAFGLPYAPFDFNSGMDLRAVERDEAIELGVIEPDQIVHPQRRDFERDTQASVGGLTSEMEQILVEQLGAGWEVVDGVLYKANEEKIAQLNNMVTIGEMYE